MCIIYEPKGKALEYSPLAANLYKGCSHGCTYCYVPGIPPYKFAKNAREQFSADPQPRKDIIKLFERSARKIAGDPRRILLSFTSDAYQPIEKQHKITRQALSIAAGYHLKTQVLTKAGAWAVERDLPILQKARCIWAATLTLDDPDQSKKWEPGAALPADRIQALKTAHKNGLKTWVSFEPVIDPAAVYRLIHETHDFVDLYKVGKLNHHPFADTIDWAEFLVTVEDLLDRYSKPRYIKKDLAAYRSKTAA